jgi:hypothetical protein
MLTAIKEEVKILPGGIIKIQSHGMKPNTMVTVSAVIEAMEPRPTKLKALIGRGKGIYKSPKHADETLRIERDKWGRHP